MARSATVNSPLGKDKLFFYSLTMTEELGRPFVIEADVFSTDRAIKLEDILGQSVTISVECPTGGTRYFNGYVSQFTQTGRASEGYAWYRMVLRPWLWLLTRTADCRIFQQKTSRDIIKAVFQDNGFSDVKDGDLTATYRTRDYTVQYRETDFHFVSRLMEQDGIYYYFTHADGQHTMVLADAVSAHKRIAGTSELPFEPPDAQGGYKDDTIFEWSLSQEIQTGAYALTDFDFTQPTADLKAQRLQKRSHPHGDSEVFDYPGQYVQSADGDAYAGIRIQELQAQYERVQGQSSARHMTVGGLFKMLDYPRDDQNREYLTVSAVHHLQSKIDVSTLPDDGEVSDAGTFYSCQFTAIDSQSQYRAPSLTRKPVVQGPQTAIVVGPSDKEIHTDEFGRVKVQFHWDRYGKKDENSSCWIRVAQIWAGAAWGAIHIPRIGQEVIVDFLEGDPDRPIITGRVYNGAGKPPYTLPDNATQSGLKSHSSASGDNKTFNELRFEDKKDSEEVYFHAEKDFNRVVENNDSLKVGFDKKDKGDRTVEVFNNETISVGCSDAGDGSQTITIWKNRTETVKEGNETVTIEKGNRAVTVSKGNDTHQISTGNREVTISKGNDTLTISQGNQTIQLDAGSSTLQAGQAIELKVGGNSIKIDTSGITIKGLQISIEGSTKVDVKGAMTNVNGDGAVKIQGGMVKVN